MKILHKIVLLTFLPKLITSASTVISAGPHFPVVYPVRKHKMYLQFTEVIKLSKRIWNHQI